MPRYTYECTNGHMHELTQGWDADVKQRCPHCRSIARRIPTPPAILFKGKGFYSTDNRASRGPRRDSDGEGDGGSDGEGGGGSDGEGGGGGDGNATANKGASAKASKPSSPSESKRAPRSRSKKRS